MPKLLSNNAGFVKATSSISTKQLVKILLTMTSIDWRMNPFDASNWYQEQFLILQCTWLIQTKLMFLMTSMRSIKSSIAWVLSSLNKYLHQSWIRRWLKHLLNLFWSLRIWFNSFNHTSTWRKEKQTQIFFQLRSCFECWYILLQQKKWKNN